MANWLKVKGKGKENYNCYLFTILCLLREAQTPGLCNIAIPLFILIFFLYFHYIIIYEFIICEVSCVNFAIVQLKIIQFMLGFFFCYVNCNRTDLSLIEATFKTRNCMLHVDSALCKSKHKSRKSRKGRQSHEFMENSMQFWLTIKSQV